MVFKTKLRKINDVFLDKYNLDAIIEEKTEEINQIIEELKGTKARMNSILRSQRRIKARLKKILKEYDAE